MNNIFKLCLVIAFALLLNACDPQSNEQATPNKLSLANPASTYCISQGGILDIQTENVGQVSYCTLPNGKRIEEWQLYKHAHQQTKVTETLKTPPAATEECTRLGGITDLSDNTCTLPKKEKLK